MNTAIWFLRGLFADRYSVPDVIVLVLICSKSPNWLGPALWLCWVLAVSVVREMIRIRTRRNAQRTA